MASTASATCSPGRAGAPRGLRMTSSICRSVSDVSPNSIPMSAKSLVIKALLVDEPWTQSGQQPLCGSKCLTLTVGAVTLTANDGGRVHEHPVEDEGPGASTAGAPSTGCGQRRLVLLGAPVLPGG